MVLAIRVVDVDVQVHRLVQLPPDGFHGPLSPGDGSLDHEHGLADLPQHPLPGGSIGGISTGRVTGIAIGRGRLALGAGNRACRASSLGVWGRIEPIALLAPHPLHM